MSAKLVLIILLVVSVGAGWFFYANYETEWKTAENGSLEYVKITPRGAENGTVRGTSDRDTPVNLPPITKKDSIRIATFNLACLASLSEDVEEAYRLLDTLKQRRVLPRRWVYDDPDLENLRASPLYEVLME